MWLENPNDWQTVRENIVTFTRFGRPHWNLHLQQHVSNPSRGRVLAEHHPRRGDPSELLHDSFTYEVTASRRHFLQLKGEQNPKIKLPKDVVETAKQLASSITGFAPAKAPRAGYHNAEPGSFVEKEMARRAAAARRPISKG